MPTKHPNRLNCSQLRWICKPDEFDFETTDDIDASQDAIEQRTAEEALLFGLQCDAPGQNIYVRGTRGTGRMQLVKRLISKLDLSSDKKSDYCYVHNFKRPNHPRLLTLQPGKARPFKRRMQSLAEFVQKELIKALDSEPYSSQRNELKEKLQKDVKAISAPLEEDLAMNNMALVSMTQGQLTIPAIFPKVDGQPMPPEQLQKLIAEGKAPAGQLEAYKKLIPEYTKRLKEIGREVNETYQEGARVVDEFNETSARQLLDELADPILRDFSGIGVKEFVSEVIDDAVENRLVPQEEGMDLAQAYGVNIVLANEDPQRRPVVIENAPSLMNLLGYVEPKWGDGGMAVSDYRGIRSGALLNADNGFLILNCQDLVNEPGAYRALMRTLRTKRLEMVPQEANWMRPYVVVQPEPIKIQVRVILIGDVMTYYQLDRFDPDFGELFKVLADFENEIPRQTGLGQYASYIAALVRKEELIPFHKSAVAALTEHGARIAARGGKLTARFGRIADIAREASYMADKENESPVRGKHVESAVRNTKSRANLPSRRFQEFVENGKILVETNGSVVGQVNGLAVMHAGPLTYGFPSRITATIGPGRAGVINIEGTAQMSGSIHTKGFHILGGLLRNLLRLTHPMAFSASIAFEQSYGGIDGDSASGAEIVCLLSALTGVPVLQGMAMTGAIDQHGHVEAIGGVNEKIEGFFDVCKYFGLTGNQGVVIPKSNVADLMLRKDIVEECDQGRFHIYGVETIHHAIELMTGCPAGQLVEGQYLDGTVLGMAVQRAHEFWQRTLSSPDQLTKVAEALEESPPPPNPLNPKSTEP